MTIFADERLTEIKRVQSAIGNALRRITIEQSRKLSWIETYAAAIRAVEDIANAPAEEVRERARKVSAECDLKTDWPADEYMRQRRAAFSEESP